MPDTPGYDFNDALAGRYGAEIREHAEAAVADAVKWIGDNFAHGSMSGTMSSFSGGELIGVGGMGLSGIRFPIEITPKK